MSYLLKLLSQNKPKLREYDPTTLQRIKEGSYLAKMISESEVATRKCDFYAGNCEDQEIANFFKEEAKVLQKSYRAMENYYESMTKE
jgi:hypothetical protein